MRPRALLAVLLFAAAASLFAQDVPPKPQAWIEDHAHIFADAQQQAINEKLENFFHASGARLYVITWPSLQGYDVTDYTNRVVRTWKMEGDRLAVMFIFPSDRKYWLQVGKGLEGDLPDATTSYVYRNTIVPNFQGGRYYEGVNDALNQFGKQIDPQWTPPASPAGSTPQRAAPSREPTPSLALDGQEVITLVFFGILFLFFVLPRMRRGGCGGCVGCIPWFPFGGSGMTFGGGSGGGGGGGGWSGGGWSSGGGSSFGGGGSGGGW